jgi:NAD(P)H-dependent FMN reductase
MTRIAIIAGSTRPGRRTESVAHWVLDQARESAPFGSGATYELLDLADFDLPLLDEPLPAIAGVYRHDHTRRWAETVDGYDGFVFVVPEYNHSFSAALKNAVDYLFAEWAHKAAGIVTIGIHGGVRAAEHLRQVLAEVKVADVRSPVAVSVKHDFELRDFAETGVFSPGDEHAQALAVMLEEVVDLADALAPLRQDEAAEVAV